MISIGGVVFPAGAYLSGEMSSGLPTTVYETDIDGGVVIYGGAINSDVDIIIPRAADGMPRSDVLRLRDLAAAGAETAVISGNRTFTAVFRYADGALDLSPLNARQTQRDTDSYYGTVRIKEI